MTNFIDETILDFAEVVKFVTHWDGDIEGTRYIPAVGGYPFDDAVEKMANDFVRYVGDCIGRSKDDGYAYFEGSLDARIEKAFNENCFDTARILQHTPCETVGSSTRVSLADIRKYFTNSPSVEWVLPEPLDMEEVPDPEYDAIRQWFEEERAATLYENKMLDRYYDYGY